MNTNNPDFWGILDGLLAESKIVIDRPRGTSHPIHPENIYPVDYGYLEGTSSMDGGGIDIWIGSKPDKKIDAVLCIVDGFKKDSEIKLLYGCSDEEKELIFSFQNDRKMRAFMIHRGTDA
jgi:inorganic pyrophosphatase